MNRHVILYSVLCLTSLYSVAQENNPLINSGQVIEAGIKLHDDGKYKEALKEYQKVPVGDTNYVWALYEMTLTCASDSQYTLGVNVCEKALKLNTDPERS